MTKLLIDDTRKLEPTAKDWVILRSGEDVPVWIERNGWPEAIALDHDLSLGDGQWDGARVAMWLASTFSGSGRTPNCFPIWDAHSRNEKCNKEIEEILVAYAVNRQVGLAPIRKR